MKVELYKGLIINAFKKFDFVISITPIGRHYSKKRNKYSNVNDLDIHLIVQKKDIRTCNILLDSCKKIIDDNEDLSCGIIDGPYKPQEIPRRMIFFFHLLIDDYQTIQKRALLSYPIVYSWSKYKPVYGENMIIKYANRALNSNDILESRFGLFKCLEFIEQGFVEMEYYSHSNREFKKLNYKLESYYGVYFLFYSIMQQIRNIQRLHNFNIEFENDNCVVRSFLKNEKFACENELRQIIGSMNSIRENGFNNTNINFQDLKEKTIQILRNMTNLIEPIYA